ncbi:TPA: hypothetical protein DDX46_01315 [Candidatus Saccharibacteria bacterium]|nr:MAG: hypothetical protein UW38_C0001G0079 [Candidatus Saccharibacteria bacterium GW2011_GWC2_44_17]OGL33026.1 MAG: hypothetical protein A3E20_00770 [Candidatus Saccharibacteria bacterium RIFCSPHIGHO2_12_FULL_47_16]HBH77367.1 hypothetical protein [Candidatus Saccharibacteria bacterium]
MAETSIGERVYFSQLKYLRTHLRLIGDEAFSDLVKDGDIKGAIEYATARLYFFSEDKKCSMRFGAVLCRLRFIELNA